MIFCLEKKIKERNLEAETKPIDRYYFIGEYPLIPNHPQNTSHIHFNRFSLHTHTQKHKIQTPISQHTKHNKIHSIKSSHSDHNTKHARTKRF